eukprot:scaffold2006_cov141-Isochrysis_galbana.AAC.16
MHRTLPHEPVRTRAAVPVLCAGIHLLPGKHGRRVAQPADGAHKGKAGQQVLGGLQVGAVQRPEPGIKHAGPQQQPNIVIGGGRGPRPPLLVAVVQHNVMCVDVLQDARGPRGAAEAGEPGLAAVTAGR